ncbi:hypothetical protein CGCS363_v004488 [Colletotrichum siamense]|uniref:uncharacterized protein n=1 Tax=Colletotrichum siamense TaxID=690259 RepID=UPI00187283EA|nr:uncharacterized protein CGCS363_v004488 [Colletotrichum siamense]KAF5505545.1 hypothetical protein CGCS363_v004488 [Colletotrichum siamense]
MVKFASAEDENFVKVATMLGLYSMKAIAAFPKDREDGNVIEGPGYAPLYNSDSAYISQNRKWQT